MLYSCSKDVILKNFELILNQNNIFVFLGSPLFQKKNDATYTAEWNNEYLHKHLKRTGNIVQLESTNQVEETAFKFF